MEILKPVLWSQFGAAIDTLEAAISACPEVVWGDRSLKPEFWYTAYHTLFWLDFYLSETSEGFAPPSGFSMSEVDPASVFPERVYTKTEMLTYLEHCRAKCRARIAALTETSAQARWRFEYMDYSVLELLLYTMRHVQHHAAQLNTLLRQTIDSAPRWVSRVKERLP